MKKLKQSSNKIGSDITEEMKNISSLINQDNFQEALERIKRYEEQNPNDKHNIDYETMQSETINLLRLTKSAIIYLINFVNTEENKKINNGLIAQMFVDTSQFL